MSEFLNTIAPFAVPGLVGLLVWIVQESRTAKRASQETENVLKSAVRVMLRNQLVAIHRGVVEREQITISEKASFLETDHLYKGLDGNGPTSHLADDVERFKVVSDARFDRPSRPIEES